MRRTFVLAALTALFLPTFAHAQQQRPRLQIGAVRIGFMAGNSAGDVELEKPPLFKAGTWAPVLVDINVGPPGLKGNEGPLEVIIETPDADDVATNYTVTRPLEAIGPNGTFTVTGYTKLAGTQSDITITLKGPDSVIVGPPYKRQHSGLNPGQPIFITAGTRMPGMRQALAGDPDKPAAQNAATFNPEGVGFIDRFQDLPENWFGYDGVDLLILSTSRRNDFLAEMASEQPPRRRNEALVEWVQRGGHLAVCVGKNYAALKDIPELDGARGLLPVTFKKSEQLRDLRLMWPDGAGAAGGIVGGPKNPFEVAIAEPKPGRTFTRLMSSRDVDAGDLPLVVQAPYTLGRVTVIAFDMDQKPFADWKGQNEFWPRLLEQASGRTAAAANAPDDMNDVGFRGRYAQTPANAELIYQFQGFLENFEDVPVISFGWVAVFILIYILVVGPLDYFFLKKVVKRLELTWITFPTVVIVVSAIAYFTAYQLKGHDLRVRKLDVVDVDLHSQQAVGRTWFTIFSPRIQHYTIGLEPAAPAWAPAATETGPSSSVLMSWLERPAQDTYAGGRARGQSLFRRAYDYEPNAVALKGVPIQVWSTKSFAASWQAPHSASQPLVKATLRRPEREETLSGDITWLQEGVDLQDVVLIYRGRVLDLTLTPGTAKKLEGVRPEFEGRTLSAWVGGGRPMTNQGTPVYGLQAPPSSSESLVRSAMFYQALDTGVQRNSYLRALDQTWRAREGRDEAILVARLKVQPGTADQITDSPATPSKLWLGALPAPGVQRPPLVGMMKQDTYVRVFIPVKSGQ